MRTESQQTKRVNFPYKNKHKKSHALHHTYKICAINTYKTNNTTIVNTNVTNVTAIFVCDVNHAI